MPSAEELWNTYPLQPSPQPAAGRKPTSSPAADIEELRGPERSASDGSPPAPLVVLAVLAGGGALLLWLRRRSLHPAPWPALLTSVVSALARTAPMPSLSGVTAAMRANGPRVSRPTDSSRRDDRAARPPRTPLRQPPPASAGLAPEHPATPPKPASAWTAEIEWRHADDGSRFCAIARLGEDAPGITVAESPPLEWPPSSSAGVEALTGAAERLAASLLAAGWKPLADGNAWYARRFEWRPAKAPVAPAERRARSGRFGRTAWPDGSEQFWRCEIRWATGYVNSRFEAVAFFPGARRGRPIAASAGFKWLLRTQPELYVEEHRAEVRRLATALAAAGWERAGQGDHWYEARFVWHGQGAPPDRVELPVEDGHVS